MIPSLLREDFALKRRPLHNGGADLRERFQWCQFSPRKTEFNGAPDLKSYEGCNQLENHHSVYEVEEQEVYVQSARRLPKIMHADWVAKNILQGTSE